MRPQSSSLLRLAGLASALIILLAAGALTYLRVLQQNRDQRWVLHTHLVLETIQDVRLDLLDQQSHLRGYVLGSKLSDLQAFRADRSQALDDLSHFYRLVADNPAQQRSAAQLEALLRSRYDALDQIVHAPPTRRVAAAQVSLANNSLSPAMYRITGLISQMEKREQDLLQIRLTEADIAWKQTRLLVSAGYALAFLLLSIVALFSRREAVARLRAERDLQSSEARFRSLVSHVHDYAIFLLDPDGSVAAWNPGAERLNGYREDEILGKTLSTFYSPEDVAAGRPARLLQVALRDGTCEDEGWHVRKDGSRYWADVNITPLYSSTGRLAGFGKVTHDMTERRRILEELQLRNSQLLASNNELEAFCYSVSHDLRTPLRAIQGFSQALLEDCSPQINDDGRDYLHRVCAATERMGVLIDDLLNLSRVTRAELRRESVDLAALALSVAADLRKSHPDRRVDFVVAPNLSAHGDPRLLRCALENLLGNAWKFTGLVSQPRVEFGSAAHNGSSAFYIRDNGAGFDPAYAARLFQPFQRLHSAGEFPGTGIGLATAQRIFQRHGGSVWATAAVGHGATFYFTLRPPSEPPEVPA